MASAEARLNLSAAKQRVDLRRLANEDFTRVEQKFCNGCGRWKDLADFGTRKYKTKLGVTSVYPRARCKRCECALQRKHERKRRAEGKRKTKRVSEMTKAEHEHMKRKWREQGTIQRRKKGVPALKKAEAQGYELLSVEPIAEFLEGRSEGKTELAGMVGISERRLLAIEKREAASVTTRSVDAILCGLGCHGAFHDLYPLKEKERLIGWGVLDPDGILEKYRDPA